MCRPIHSNWPKSSAEGLPFFVLGQGWVLNKGFVHGYAWVPLRKVNHSGFSINTVILHLRPLLVLLLFPHSVLPPHHTSSMADNPTDSPVTLCDGEEGCGNEFPNKTRPGLCARCFVIKEDEAAGKVDHIKSVMVSLRSYASLVGYYLTHYSLGPSAWTAGHMGRCSPTTYVDAAVICVRLPADVYSS